MNALTRGERKLDKAAKLLESALLLAQDAREDLIDAGVSPQARTDVQALIQSILKAQSIADRYELGPKDAPAAVA